MSEARVEPDPDANAHEDEMEAALEAAHQIERAIREHDEAVARTGLEIWVGSEPTFTDRNSTDPAWLVGAVGADKEARARALLADLRDGLVSAALHPRFAPLADLVHGEIPSAAARAVVLRSVGRRYPGEEVPRWSYGLFCLRDGAPLWDGPRDPLETGSPGRAQEEDEPGLGEAKDAQTKPDGAGAEDTAMAAAATEGAATERAVAEQPAGQDADGTAAIEAPALSDVAAVRLRDHLAAVLTESARTVATFDCEGPLPYRVVFRTDEVPAGADPSADPRLARTSFHTPAPGEVAPVDALAAEGAYLVSIGMERGERGVVRVELPAFPDVSAFVAFLQDMADAARRAEQDALVLAGHPPPVNPSAAWTTVTPDPGVVEVNMAPAPNVSTFLKWLRELHSAAVRHDLSPLRYWFNGDVADSGGGGHVTLGGPTPGSSPFFLRPLLLPALIAYLNHHPGLSYLFAVDSLGSSSQSPRPDEGVRESFEELSLALSLLSRHPSPTPEQIWASLGPFLADRFGNVHRSEVNVEKLWNPYLPGRGRWGVVELRALRMPATPERAAALAALFRALAAMLSRATEVPALIDWGATLHDRFALPFFLERDLESVLADLDSAGQGLPEALATLLRDDGHRTVGEADLSEVRVTIRRAIEFWPLVGDPTTQEARTARLIDSSTTRLEIAVRPAPDQPDDVLSHWRLAVGDVLVPLSLEHDASGAALVTGVRLRAFVPTPGLHPTLTKQLPLSLDFFAQGAAEATRITLHDWRPDGHTYDGLPHDAAEARRRREERFVVEEVSLDGRRVRPAPAEAVTPHALDLRQLGNLV